MVFDLTTFVLFSLKDDFTVVLILPKIVHVFFIRSLEHFIIFYFLLFPFELQCDVVSFENRKMNAPLNIIMKLVVEKCKREIGKESG